MIILPGQTNDTSNLETSGGKVDLDRIKSELREVQQDANRYFRRVEYAIDWWQSRWQGQTADGRKWWKYEDQLEPFPWPGSSDTRVRLVKDVVNQFKTLCMYGLMNMRLQAKSTRPAATPQESQQVTTMLNWMVFTHMPQEWYLETELAISYAGAYGCAIVSVDWEQERRLDHIPITLAQFAAWIQKVTNQQLSLLDLQDILQGSEYEKELIALIQEISPIITTSQARSILNDLRKDGQTEVPVPYLYKSKPRIMALRPMIDVFFSPDAFDLQRERWIDRPEYVTEAVLNDRIETDGYDPGFVEEAVKRKGVYSTDFGYNSFYREPYGFNVIRPGNRPDQTSINQENGLIELHHFNHYSLDMGVPCLYKTVFHMELDDYAVSGVSEYQHGQMPLHAIRFECNDRPILSSQGIPETAYTWENELKVQLDGRTDLASIKVAPPMLCDHADEEKLAQKYRPHGLIGGRPGRRPEFAPTPPYDPSPVQVSEDIKARVREYFGWFGADLDPQLKQMRQMEVVDRMTTQFKPVVNQIGMLCDQMLPDDTWLRVTGLPPRKGIRDRQSVQGQYELTMTCDIRELDADFMDKKAKAIANILPIDSTGVIDRTVVVRNLFEGLDYTLADMAIRSTEAATQKEITDEMEKVSLIIGSGVEQPLPPEGSNFNLRLQTMMNVLNATPFIKQRVAQSPDVLKVLENRWLYLTRQIQQGQNAVIGRTQVGSAANPLQPPTMAPQLTQ